MQPCKKHAGKAFQDSTRACTWAHTHSARRHVNKLFETHLHYFLVHAATPSFSPLRLSSASWPTTSLSAKCQRATSALSPKPSSASTFGAIGQANMACRAHCMCLRAQLVSLGPAVHQAALQDGSRARKEAYLCAQQWQGEWQGEGGHGLVPQPARGRGIGSSSSSSSSSVVNGAVIGSVQLCRGGGATELFVN